MANVNDEALDVLAQQMRIVAKNETDNAKYTKEYIGIVEEVVDSTKKKFKIRYNNATYEINTTNALKLNPYDKVHIIVPNNNIRDKYMLEDLIVTSVKLSS